MSIIYRTKVDSETGRKLAAILGRHADAQEKMKEEIKALNIGEAIPYIRQHWLCGPPMVLKLPKGQEMPEGFRTKDGKIMLDKRTKAGKVILKKWEENIPVIKVEELNEAVGLDKWNARIGFQQCDLQGYYIFTIGDDWEYTAPDDCEEIMHAERNRMVDAERNLMGKKTETRRMTGLNDG